MLKNYFTISIRNMLKRKFFTSINILGMTVGITACLLIALYIIDEFSYDRFHANAARIFQVGGHNKFGNVDQRSVSTCPPLADAMMAEIPEVESTLRLTSGGAPVLHYGDKVFKVYKVFETEKNFFEFFSFKLISGNPKTALQEPNTLVLTETVARKLFGDEDPLEKLISLDEGSGMDTVVYKVTGVAADCPGNSHLKFNVLLSPRKDTYFKLIAWLNGGVYTYFTLRKNTSVADVEKKMEALVAKYIAPDLKKFLGNSPDRANKSGGGFRYYATNITDIHLKSTSLDEMEPGGSMTYMMVFGGIGIFILALACINFINMSTAQSAGRAKEVGLRKTLGSPRSQMIGQFLAESMLYSFFAVALAVMLCFFLLPALNLLAGKELSFDNLLDAKFLSGVVLLLLIVGLLAGSYPAFYLTSFRPADVLKGKVRTGIKSKGIRSTLVIFQFAISMFLIIFTSVVYTQINFMQQQQMGMDKENVLVIENMSKLGNNGDAFRHALAGQTGISKVSFADKLPSRWPGTAPMRSGSSATEHSVAGHRGDWDFQDVLKFEIKEGRYFSRSFVSDSNAVVINEAAAREFGFQTYEGQEILFSPNAFVFKHYHVIGIMKDFNFETYRNTVKPLVIFLNRSPEGDFQVRYEGNAKKVIDNITKVWKQFAGSEPIEYTFMDESFDNLYRSEERIGRVLGIFSGLAIFIACLGLFALAAFTTEQRTKEIGIRKVLGASVGSLSMTLTKEFIVLVFIAFVPAATIGWWMSSQWLSGFAFRVEINLFVFVFAGVCAVAIAWLTVGYQSIKAARANPVESLRHE